MFHLAITSHRRLTRGKRLHVREDGQRGGRALPKGVVSMVTELQMVWCSHFDLSLCRPIASDVSCRIWTPGAHLRGIICTGILLLDFLYRMNFNI